MRVLIITALLIAIGNAEMCGLYWNRLLGENTKLTKAINLNMTKAIKRQYEELIYYSEKVAINCPTGQKQEQTALKTIVYAKQQLKSMK